MRDFNKYENKLFEFLRSYPFPKGVSVYLFGSRARGDHRNWSDLDIGLENLPNDFNFVDLEEAVDKLNLPYEVQLVRLETMSKEFYNKYRAEAINILEIK